MPSTILFASTTHVRRASKATKNRSKHMRDGSIFFRSADNKQRFLAAMQETGKVYDGQLDQEYGAGFCEKLRDYVSRDGIDIEAILAEVNLSRAYAVLVHLARNLINDRTRCDAI